METVQYGRVSRWTTRPLVREGATSTNPQLSRNKLEKGKEKTLVARNQSGRLTVGRNVT
jgi:hypothetical protein